MSNLDDWLKVLEAEKQRAIEKIKACCQDERIVQLAVKDLAVEVGGAKHHLIVMAGKNYRLSPTLSRIDEDYRSNEDYRFWCNLTENHLARIRNLHKKVEEGNFTPSYHYDRYS